MNDKPTITTIKDGPYILAGLDELRDFSGKIISIKSPVSLCRCGASESKPFCDGTHVKLGFKDDRSTIHDSKTRDYVGKKITIHDNRSICSHPGFCYQDLPTVFDMSKHPWVNPDGDKVESIITIIKRCPSGALSYTIDGVKCDSFSDTPSVRVLKDGPYIVRGHVELIDERQPVSKEHYSLCRCGLSHNKPFCDGEHFRQGFWDDGVIKK